MFVLHIRCALVKSTNLSPLSLVSLLSPWGPTILGTLSPIDALKSPRIKVGPFVLVLTPI